MKKRKIFWFVFLATHKTTAKSGVGFELYCFGNSARDAFGGVCLVGGSKSDVAP